jgi:type 1 glutamine amidotransferase
MNRSLLATALLFVFASSAGAADPWVVYPGGDGPGQGKHIVLVSGDEEYRSEEAMPMLGKLLSVRHGFKCTVLFSVNPDDGTIDPVNQKNVPGLENLQSADLMIIATRFRELPDEQMKYVDEYVNAGKPVIGLRTATHAFKYEKGNESRFKKYHFGSTEWPGGFGQQVLGETWVSHHGHHKVESTRGVVNDAQKSNPILNGVKDVWGPTDVYTVKNLPESATILLFGQVLEGMEPDSKPLAGPKNDPMMPLAWTKTFTGTSGKPARIFCTTMGASVDLACEDLRRLIVNAAYWAVDLEDKIPEKANADVVGEYEPTFYGFGKFKPGLKPSDHAL